MRPDTCAQFRREPAKRLKPNLNGLLLDPREQDLFPTALPFERQVWKHPDLGRVKALAECAKKNALAKDRMRPDAEMSRAMDYQLSVAQDALICSLTHPR